MPERPLRPCQSPGCGVLGKGTYCEAHGQQRQRERHRAHDQRRGSSTARGYDYAWQRLRLRKLKTDPLCAFHLERRETVLAQVVDHIKTIAEAPELRLVWGNLRSLCKPCHDKRTLSESSPAPRPRGLKPSRIPLTILCGPAGSGKTTWIEKRAGPNDLVIDLAIIKQRLAHGADCYGVAGPLLRRALVERNRLLASLATDSTHDRAWFVVGAPLATDRRWWQDALRPERILVFEVDPGECQRRIEASRCGRHRDMSIRIAFQWWEQYVRRDGDAVVG